MIVIPAHLPPSSAPGVVPGRERHGKKLITSGINLGKPARQPRKSLSCAAHCRKKTRSEEGSLNGASREAQATRRAKKGDGRRHRLCLRELDEGRGTSDPCRGQSQRQRSRRDHGRGREAPQRPYP